MKNGNGSNDKRGSDGTVAHSVRLPVKLSDAIRKLAASERRPFNYQIVHMLEQGVSQEPA